MSYFEKLKASKAEKPPGVTLSNFVDLQYIQRKALLGWGFPKPWVAEVIPIPEAQRTAYYWNGEFYLGKLAPVILASVSDDVKLANPNWYYGVVDKQELELSANPHDVILDAASFQAGVTGVISSAPEALKMLRQFVPEGFANPSPAA